MLPEGKYAKGWLKPVIFSVTVEIHGQIGDLKKQKKEPGLIKLGPHCSVRFCYEHTGQTDLRKAPGEYLGIEIIYRYEFEGVFVEPF